MVFLRLTFHCVMRDKYPTEAVQLRIHMSSECAGTYGGDSLARNWTKQMPDTSCRSDKTDRRLEKERRPLGINPNG